MNSISAFHITITQGFMFLAAGIACLVFVALSLYYIIEWHRFGVKEKDVFISEAVYLIVSLLLLAVAILSATFF